MIPVVFMHLPKCAGHSIYSLFEKAAGADSVISFAESYVSNWDLLKTRAKTATFIGGHLYLSKIEVLFPKDNINFIFTMLREPIDQLASHMRWIDRYNLAENDEIYRSLDVFTKRVVDEIALVDFKDPGSLDHFLSNLSPKGISYFDNMQSRYFLAGAVYGIEQWTPLTLNLTPELLSAMTKVSLIGHLSLFEPSLRLLAEALKLDIPVSKISKCNVNDSGRVIDTENGMIRDVLRKRLLLDEWISREVLYRIQGLLQNR